MLRPDAPLSFVGDPTPVTRRRDPAPASVNRMSAKPQASVLAKIVGAAATMIAAWLVQQVIGRIWQRQTGHKPPKAEDQGDAGLSEVMIAAAITGALVAMSRVLATRGAARITTHTDLVEKG